MIKVIVIVNGCHDYHIKFDTIKISKFDIEHCKTAYPLVDNNYHVLADTPKDCIIFKGGTFDVIFVKQMHIK